MNLAILSLWCTRDTVGVPRCLHLVLDLVLLAIVLLTRVWQASVCREFPDCRIWEIVDDHDLWYYGFCCRRMEHEHQLIGV